MLNILMVENTQSRVNAFKRNISENCRFAHAKTSNQAIRAIKKYNFDFIFLDYNLDGGKTTEPLANWMIEHDKEIYIPRNIIIHSMDSKGSSHLKEILETSFKFKVSIIQDLWDNSLVIEDELFVSL